jgi:hypothetical protein
MHSFMGAPMAHRGLVHGQDHVAEGDGHGVHANADAGEESGEEAAAGLEGVITPAKGRTARGGDEDTDEGKR